MRLLSPRDMMASSTCKAGASGCVIAGSFHTVPTSGSGTPGAVAVTLRGCVRSGTSRSKAISTGFSRRGMSAKYLSTIVLRSDTSKLPATIRVAVSGP